ncbi:MAG: flagellar hook protein FlgE [Candidatus Eremiobacteraeota bacterium]|nr:flagellar hook protein FlgE [Candidatus Eremiobacteraeota bacterium]
MAFDSLFIGVTGLNAFQNQIDVISNNIANTGTTGYKGQRVTFADLLYQQQGFASAPTQTRGGVNGIDVGLGTKVNTIDTLFQQGGLETTGVNTDLAINGDGFFILNNVNGTGTPSYTRDGAFSLNQNGLLYDPSSGLSVQGYMANPLTNVISATGQPGAINIPIGLKAQAQGTGAVGAIKVGPSGDNVFDLSAAGNLDVTQFVAEATTPGTGKPATISTTVYDSLGTAHQMSIVYTPVAAGSVGGGPVPATVNNNQGVAQNTGSRFRVQAYFTDGTLVNGAAATQAAPFTMGYSFYDQNGQFINTSAALSGAGAHLANAAPSAAAGDLINVTQWGGPPPPGGPAIPANIGADLAQGTALAGSYTANVLTQNGYAQGILSNITIGQDGTVLGAFTNGQSRALAQVAMATFQNEQGLQRVGGNKFGATANSGLAQVGTGTVGRFGSIQSGSLEQSNVSLADEFTKMILAQRSFQANARSISVADQDLQLIVTPGNL